MVLARTLLMLFGVLSVLLLGAVSPVMAADSPPPCHEMSDAASHDKTPSQHKPIKSMGCCVACVAAPVITPPVRAELNILTPLPEGVAHLLPTGRGLSPETGPPRA